MTDVRSKLPDHADQHEVDVAVVGGGPGGLATAAAVLSAFGDTFKVKVRCLMSFAKVRRLTSSASWQTHAYTVFLQELEQEHAWQSRRHRA